MAAKSDWFAALFAFSLSLEPMYCETTTETPVAIAEKRLIKRSTETIEQIKLRMQRIDYELKKSSLYDYTVVNDKLEQAIIDVESIINKEKNK